MRLPEAFRGESEQTMDGTVEKLPDRWRDNPPVDKAWFDVAALSLLQRHAKGTEQLPLPEDSTSTELVAAAERKAFDLWQIACNGRFELAQAKRRSTERLTSFLTRATGLIGASAALMGSITGAAEVGQAMDAEATNESRQATWEDEDRVTAREEQRAEESRQEASRARLVSGAEGRMFEIDLTGLDRTVTPERMGRIINETYPKGWMRNTASVTFEPRLREMPKSYGMQGRAAAERIMMMGGDRIVFYISSESDTSNILNLMLAHEVAHTLDWNHPWNSDNGAAMKIKDAVEQRLDAKNAHPSDYLASINNADKSIERKHKRNEYPAIISEAYIGSGEPEEFMVSEDIALAEAIVKLTDPAFDRDAAWEKRRGYLDEMAREQFAERLEVFMTHLPPGREMPRLPGLQEKLKRAWLVHNEPTTPEAAAAGRAALADFLRRWSGSVEERQLAEDQLKQLHAFHRLAIDIGDSALMRDREISMDLLIDTFQLENNLDKATRDKIIDDFKELTARFPINYGGKLEEGEYARLMDLGKAWENPTVLIRTMGFRPAIADRPLAAIAKVTCPAASADDQGRSGLL